jgi:serine/threonine protein kinase
MEIGGGAFASVYRARQKSLDRWVAIKIISEKDRTRRAQLLKEARTQAQVHIDCVPQVYDAFEWGSRVCIVMQWLKGVSLASLLEKGPAGEERVWLADGLITAVAALHRQGYAHRDLKPANVIVSPEEGIFLIDFGFTRHVDDAQRSMAGVVKGTPAYMAPELWLGREQVDYQRADLYSVGKILRTILADHPLSPITDRLLADNPQKRPASGTELLEQWNGLLERRPLLPSWEHIAATPAAEALAGNLFSAARYLLHGGREEEAYWLLVECLEQSPDMPEAIELMASFPREAKRRAARRRVIGLSSAAAVCLLLVAAFLTGRHSRERSIPSTPSSPMEKRSLMRLSPSSLLEKNPAIALKQDSSKSHLLTGTIIVQDNQHPGRILVDGTQVGRLRETSRISLAPGRHTLQLRLDNQGIAWRRTIDILPFEVKTISMSSEQ